MNAEQTPTTAASADTETRIVCCSVCGGDGSFDDENLDRWSHKCLACDGKGEIEVEVAPVTLEDVTNDE